VIVTANSGPASGQHTDVEIVDSSPQQNVYLRKRSIKAETRMAITTHTDGDVGVCFYNYLDEGPCAGLIVGIVLMCFLDQVYLRMKLGIKQG
jgi:hypothetical protein